MGSWVISQCRTWPYIVHAGGGNALLSRSIHWLQVDKHDRWRGAGWCGMIVDRFDNARSNLSQGRSSRQ
ncbi:hypothetical protein CS542_08955 [Pedobacter sp. IW39]|nr:hypothetical protein CS542_08955 [Pedobacter sp. IW39]